MSDTLRDIDSIDLNFSRNANMLIRASDVDLLVQERGFWSRTLGLGNSNDQEFFILGGADDTVRLFDEWSQIDTRFFNGNNYRILASQSGSEVIVVGIDTDIQIQLIA